MPAETNVQNARIALFIDIENLVSAASTMGLPIDVSPALDKLKEHGRVLVRRSFGDLEKCLAGLGEGPRLRHQIRQMLHQNLIQIEDIPFVTAKKNTADIRLVIEALSLAYQYQDITHYAIMSSDRDYVPLYNKLHELGRKVITIGIDQANTHQMVRDASDILIYYESLFQDQRAGIPEESEEDTGRLLDSYHLLLRQAIETLENQGSKPAGSAVAMMMRQLRSDFSPEMVGCKGFKGFIQDAEQERIVSVVWPTGPGDFIITANQETKIPRKAAVSAPVVPAINPVKLMKQYRKALEGKMRIVLPDLETRRQILKALAETYEVLVQEGSFTLVEWSAAAEKRIALHNNSMNRGQPPIFKILMSLYFARCFHCAQGSVLNNPTIVGLAHDPSHWEQKLHYQMARVVKFEINPEKIVPDVLKQLLFESAQITPRENEGWNAILQELVVG